MYVYICQSNMLQCLYHSNDCNRQRMLVAKIVSSTSQKRIATTNNIRRHEYYLYAYRSNTTLSKFRDWNSNTKLIAKVRYSAYNCSNNNNINSTKNYYINHNLIIRSSTTDTKTVLTVTKVNDAAADDSNITKTSDNEEVDSSMNNNNKMSSKNNKSTTTTTSILTTLKAYYELGKMKLSSLVVSTTLAGYIAAGPMALIQYNTVSSVLLGTALCSCSAAAYNQIYELKYDARMKRTIHRPLVTGILSPTHATIIASIWGISGVSVLYYCTDTITTLFGLSNIILYSCIYTPLKTKTIYNTWIGAIVGAIPPLMGYTAAMNAISVSSSLPATTTLILPLIPSCHVMDNILLVQQQLSQFCYDPIAISLVTLLYTWQLPHFMALSYMYRIDYTRGGFIMIPTISTTTTTATATTKTSETMNPNEQNTNNSIVDQSDNSNVTTTAGTRTADVMVRYTWYLSMVPIFSTMTDVTSSMYLLESMVLNAYFISMAYKFKYHQSNQNARNVFLTSLWYLPCTLMLFLLHSKSWDTTTVTTDDTTTQSNNETTFLSKLISDQIHTIRNKGRELCIHEQAVMKNNTTTSTLDTENDKNNLDATSNVSCPVVLARKTDPKYIVDATSNLHHPTIAIPQTTTTTTNDPQSVQNNKKGT